MKPKREPRVLWAFRLMDAAGNDVYKFSLMDIETTKHDADICAQHAVDTDPLAMAYRLIKYVREDIE